MMTKFVGIVLFVYLISVCAFAQNTSVEEKRTYLGKGDSFLGVQFRKDGTVFYQDKVLMGCNTMGEADSLEVSTPTPKRGLSLVKCTYENSAYVIDTINKVVLSKDIIGMNEFLGHFISWSPDEKYLIAVRGGEGICITFVIYNLDTFRSRDLPLKDCGGKSNTNDFEEKNFLWLNNTTFRVQMDIHCNPYDDDSRIDCPREKVLRSYNAQINVSNMAVTYGGFGSKQGIQSKASINKNATRPVSTVEEKITSVATLEFSKASVWSPRGKGVGFYGTWEKIHRKCEGGGGFSAWRNSAKKVGIKQETPESKFINCIAAELKKAGASPSAIEFSKQLKGEFYMVEFQEFGRVDVAFITAPLVNDPNVSEWVFVNGEPQIMHLYDKIEKVDISRDKLFPKIKRQFPNAEIWPMHAFDRAVNLPLGGQRFIFSFLMLNGCRACDLAGWAIIAFDFHNSGKFVEAKLLNLEEFTESADKKIRYH